MKCNNCENARYSSGGMGTPVEFLGCKAAVCVLIRNNEGEQECSSRREVSTTPDVPDWSNVR